MVTTRVVATADRGTVRIVIADDHPPTRAGIRAALKAPPFDVVEEAGDATGAVKAVTTHRPDLVLLDVDMPGSGLAAAAEINSEFPGVAIVMLTASDNDQDLFTALRFGAVGYLLKDIDPARLPLALEGVMGGEAAVPRRLMAKVVHEFRSRDRRRLPLPADRNVKLTEREWEVLEMMDRGMTTADMAQEMFVSPVTVRSHVSAILRKLQATDRDEAVRIYRHRS